MRTDLLGTDAGQARGHAAGWRCSAWGTVYEPKWDGYRAILERTTAGCRVWSRNGADLAEIVRAAHEQLEPGTVIDGELVVWRGGRLDFGALAPRLAYRGRRRPPEDFPPASLLAFDVLAAGHVDIRPTLLRDRRAVLVEVAAAAGHRCGRCAEP